MPQNRRRFTPDVKAQIVRRHLSGKEPVSKLAEDQWKDRYGKVTEHNAMIPRDFWLEDWERQAILDYHDQHPLEGYRRLTFMMLDDDVVAVSPASIYRVLKVAGRLDNRNNAPSKKGTGFVQPLQAHQHRHVDVSYINVQGRHDYADNRSDGPPRGLPPDHNTITMTLELVGG